MLFAVISLKYNKIKFLVHTRNTHKCHNCYKYHMCLNRTRSLPLPSLMAKLEVKAKDLIGFYGEGGKVILKKIE